LFSGGRNNLGNPFNIIEYITIATTGNATDFGDLTQNTSGHGACSSLVTGVFGGGGSSANVISYVTIASTGDAADFGDLTDTMTDGGGLSNCHGGL
jgi:hypothetical protein